MIAKVMVDFKNQNFLLKYFSLPKKICFYIDKQFGKIVLLLNWTTKLK